MKRQWLAEYEKRTKENLGRCLRHRKCTSRCCCCSVTVRLATLLACDSDNFLQIEVFTFPVEAQYFQLEDILPTEDFILSFLMLQLVISMCLFFLYYFRCGS